MTRCPGYSRRGRDAEFDEIEHIPASSQAPRLESGTIIRCIRGKLRGQVIVYRATEGPSFGSRIGSRTSPEQTQQDCCW
jgi:hypothetical protein